MGLMVIGLWRPIPVLFIWAECECRAIGPSRLSSGFDNLIIFQKICMIIHLCIKLYSFAKQYMI